MAAETVQSVSKVVLQKNVIRKMELIIVLNAQNFHVQETLFRLPLKINGKKTTVS